MFDRKFRFCLNNQASIHGWQQAFAWPSETVLQLVNDPVQLLSTFTQPVSALRSEATSRGDLFDFLESLVCKFWCSYGLISKILVQKGPGGL